MSRALPALAVAAALSSACSVASPWVSPDEHQRLVRQQLELERRAAQAELEIERLKQRLAELERGDAPTSVPGSLAPVPSVPDPAEALDAPVAGWRDVRGAIEESELAELATVPATPTAGAVSEYERGLMLLRDGDPVAAEAALLAFAGSGSNPDLGDNAWFWIGESRLARGDNPGAIDAYRRCLELHPDGNKVPDAMLKLGHAYATAGDAAAAREVWTELLNRFPSTAAAERARARLGGF